MRMTVWATEFTYGQTEHWPADWSCCYILEEIRSATKVGGGMEIRIEARNEAIYLKFQFQAWVRFYCARGFKCRGIEDQTSVDSSHQVCRALSIRNLCNHSQFKFHPVLRSWSWSVQNYVQKLVNNRQNITIKSPNFKRFVIVNLESLRTTVVAEFF